MRSRKSFMLSSLSSTIMTCLGIMNCPYIRSCSRCPHEKEHADKRLQETDSARYRDLVEEKVTYRAKCKATSRLLNYAPPTRRKRRLPFSPGLPTTPICSGVSWL